ncbi:MAG: hypothetical protein LC777_05415 [Actinobacteria bacterium]|nr:hypothetical protein [Actinomycetota bacterium]
MLPRPFLSAELAYALERGLDGLATCQKLFPIARAVVLHPEPADEPGQRKALEDERGEDHREGEEDQQVPLREGCTRTGGRCC